MHTGREGQETALTGCDSEDSKVTKERAPAKPSDQDRSTVSQSPSKSGCLPLGLRLASTRHTGRPKPQGEL